MKGGTSEIQRARRRVAKLEKQLAGRRLDLQTAARSYARKPGPVSASLDLAALAFANALEELRVADAVLELNDEREVRS